MAKTVDDFIKRSEESGATIHEHEAAKYHDRFVSGKRADSDFDNRAYQQGVAEYIAKLSDKRFHDAARNALTQARQQQKRHLLARILKALRASSGQKGLEAIANTLGLPTTDPRMSGDDAARLLNYVRQEHSELLRQTLSKQPWFIKGMGNRIILGGLNMAAIKLLGQRRI